MSAVVERLLDDVERELFVGIGRFLIAHSGSNKPADPASVVAYSFGYGPDRRSGVAIAPVCGWEFSCRIVPVERPRDIGRSKIRHRSALAAGDLSEPTRVNLANAHRHYVGIRRNVVLALAMSVT
jgi:hypothetical protein